MSHLSILEMSKISGHPRSAIYRAEREGILEAVSVPHPNFKNKTMLKVEKSEALRYIKTLPSLMYDPVLTINEISSGWLTRSLV